MQDIGTFLGLLTAGLAVSLSDLLGNLAGWLFILTRRPYVVGDRIELAGHVGDVIDVRLFQTLVLECGKWVDAEQSTGRIIMIPNGMVFKNTTANYTTGFEYIWDELHVQITFESDWKRCKEILLALAREHTQSLSTDAQRQIRKAASKHMIFFQHLEPTTYTAVKESGVQISLRYLTLPRQRRGTKQILWEAILEAFSKEPKIDLAYQTIRYYQNDAEGKPEMRAVPADKSK